MKLLMLSMVEYFVLGTNLLDQYLEMLKGCYLGTLLCLRDCYYMILCAHKTFFSISSAMKRATPWSNEEDESSEESSSQSDSDSDGVVGKTKAKNSLKPEKSSKAKSSEGKSAKKKATAMNFEALKQHGYKGGLSVLGVPLPKEEIKQDWSWSKGEESREKEAADESYEERQRTRIALANGEQLVGVQTRKDKKMESFSQKEKRKRDLGQASRGKSYAEEEKRLLRDSGIYSGFDN
ncbi:hypothetical protein SAY86_005893 [Trapa natans]|uniref:Uncharacterized protein n=1 Tax=Trapa natans TaxID=22666 RepID=A0AAN7L8V4_TRANT|nr:hypothetical protein SAY86_005893 [Trapa natans]